MFAGWVVAAVWSVFALWCGLSVREKAPHE